MSALPARLVALLVYPAVAASGQSIGPLKIVSLGDPTDANKPVREVALAGRSGKFVTMWMGGYGQGDDPCWYSVSRDSGGTWDPNTPFTLDGLDPSIAGGADGSFVGLFLQKFGVLGESRIYSTLMSPNESSFQAPVHRFTGTINLDLPSVAPGPGVKPGETSYHVACWEFPNLRYARWDGPGYEWPEVLTTIPKEHNAASERYPSIAASGQRVYLGYLDVRNDGVYFNIGLYKSTDHGESFQRLPFLDGVQTDDYTTAVNGPYEVAPFPYVAVDAADPDRVYVLYPDCADGLDESGNCDVDIWLIRSTNGGADWLAPQRINQDSAVFDKERDQFMPRIAVDGSWVHIIWLDTRRKYVAPGGEYYDIDLYYAFSSDYGANFTERTLGLAIRPGALVQNGFIGHYNGLAVSGNKVVVTFMGTPPITQIDGSEDEGAERVYRNETIVSITITH